MKNIFYNKNAEKIFVAMVSEMSDTKRKKFSNRVKSLFDERITAENDSEEYRITTTDLDVISNTL